jgi:putative transposase
LLHTMGIEAIYPKPHLSQGHPTHRVYPYLLRGVPITRVNHVWSTDITYIRLHGGFGLDHRIGHLALMRPQKISSQPQ